MSSVVIVGAQWGDEGKGKVVDCLSESADMVVRFNGGANAGHTIIVDDEEYILHLIPSGAIREKADCVIGNGCVIDVDQLLSEYDELMRRRIDLSKRLFISGFAHLVLPHHKAADGAWEGNSKIALGTTKRGIGPAYCDKYARFGVRAEDLLDEKDLRNKLEAAYAYRSRWSGAGEYPGLEEVFEHLRKVAKRLAPFIVDTSLLINKRIDDGKRVLFEGAQGTLLDVDFGTYPYVTSSNPVAPFAAIGAGVGIRQLDMTIGVVKAYLTRVGTGPFPTELDNEVGEKLRQQGGEVGRTTGRNRRTGWLDLIPLRLSARVNGLDGLVVSKLDVLDSYEEIPVCVAYKLRGKTITEVPLPVALMDEVEPVYKVLPGWQSDTSEVTKWSDLPAKAQEYLKFIAEGCGIPVSGISVGQRRDQIIWLEEVFQ